jgi:hypothetical protein
VVTPLLYAVFTALLALGAGRLARQAWGWGDAMPARFVGLEALYRVAPALALSCGALAVFFGFFAATHGATDEGGGSRVGPQGTRRTLLRVDGSGGGSAAAHGRVALRHRVRPWTWPWWVGESSG